MWMWRLDVCEHCAHVSMGMGGREWEGGREGGRESVLCMCT